MVTKTSFLSSQRHERGCSLLFISSHLKTEANMNSTDFQLQEMEKSVQLFEEGNVRGVCLAIGISIVALVGIIIRGLFIYYVKYAAPKERPINTLMLYDQVSNMLLQIAYLFKKKL